MSRRTGSRRRGRIVLLLLSLVTAFGAGRLLPQEKSSKEYLEAIDREEGVLGRLRREIEENERKRRELAKRETNVLAEIHNLEKKIDLTDRLISGLEQDIALRQGELAELDARIAGVGGDLSETREAFHRRLRAFYKRRNVHPFEAVFGAATFADAVRRARYIALVVGEDRRQIETFSGLAEELSGTREARRKKLAEITSRRDEVERERASLGKAEKEKEALHASVRKQKTQREDAIQRLREETERLEGLIVNLEKKRTMAVERERRGLYSLDKAIGMLRWPVDGSVVMAFGSRVDPDLGTRIESNGIDIRAEQGAAVRSVAPGRVEFSDWWQAYGKMVIVSHSAGYYSLYSHLSRVLIAVGKDVKEGDVIGEVGDTGSLDGPMLHFEIRKGRKALDPRKYLRKR